MITMTITRRIIKGWHVTDNDDSCSPLQCGAEPRRFHPSLCDPTPTPNLTCTSSSGWFITLGQLTSAHHAHENSSEVKDCSKFYHLGISSVRALKFSLFSARLGRHTWERWSFTVWNSKVCIVRLTGVKWTSLSSRRIARSCLRSSN